MSEASRQRWLFIHNRLEELAAKHGLPPRVHAIDCDMDEDCTCGLAWLGHTDADPSWGPVGSLAEQLLSVEEYAHIVEQTEQLNQMERSARQARGEIQPSNSRLAGPEGLIGSHEPSRPARVLRLSEALRTLDQYGETSLFACEQCDEEFAKASVRLGLWHCTACGVWGQLPGGRRPRTADW